MSLDIFHTDPSQQPLAAAVAAEIHRALPKGQTRLVNVTRADSSCPDLILAVFSLRAGSLAPTVACFRELRGMKVAYVALLSGPIDTDRLKKTVWGIKKQFCGNQLVAGYLCPCLDEEAWGVSETELVKVVDFAKRIALEHLAGPVVNPVPSDREAPFGATA